MTVLDQNRAMARKSICFSEVISALSYALDITEGQPVGHAARSCLIGMRIAQELFLSKPEQTALFYGLLLKDLGCSSNASKVCSLFGSDDRTVKRDLKTTNWTRLFDSVGYLFRNAANGTSIWRRVSRVASLAAEGSSTARELVQIRCDRGAKIARDLLLPELTAVAIHSLDEHWNGRGYPDGLVGDKIPRLARIMNLAQTIEVFWHRDGIDAACDMAVDRSGKWFDPELVGAFLGLRSDPELHENFKAADAATAAASVEPPDQILPAGDDQLERLAVGFSEVVDAKSPWTYEHSRGVARLSEGMGAILDISGRRLRKLRWAALLHDIGKLGVSNLILDKPAKLDADELVQMRKHTTYTHEILRRVQGFDEFAEMAAAHHERLDGRGYHRGIAGDELSLEMRILAVADIYEALAARRPYRQERTTEEALTIIGRETGSGLCPVVVSALKTFLAQSRFVPHQVAA